jgi:uncharacterized protein
MDVPIFAFSHSLAVIAPVCKSCGFGVLSAAGMEPEELDPGFASEVLYIIAQVDLEEGLRILTNLVGCSSSDLQIGMPLEVTFEAITD